MTKLQPFVSIIIPVYNVESYLKECMKGVMNQTYKHLEILLINDGSTDKSGVMCDELSKEDKRIKVIHIENQGVSNARNLGIKNSKGEFIVFVDSDDTVERDMIQVMIETMIKYDVDLVITQIKRYFINSGYVEKSNMQYSGLCNSMKTFIGDCFLGKNKYNFITSSCGKIYKKEILNKNKIKFDEKLKYGEDTLFVFEYLIASSNIYILDHFYPYIYNININSATFRFEKQKYQRRKYMISKYKDLLNPDFKKEYLIVYFYAALDVYYSFSRISLVSNKLLIKNELTLMLKDSDLKNSYKYISNASLNIREMFICNLFKFNCNKLLFKILYIKNMINTQKC